MSRHKHNFHCFNAVGGEGFHKPSQPLEHHDTRLPKMTQHGMMTYHELEQECYLCSAYRHAQTVEDEENQLLPFYHTHPPYHHHHPHQYILSGPSRQEETHSANDRHVHHQRRHKKIVLVKNSDPSFRKTIVLHSEGLHSFGLFLEEVSELMQYHIRKLYTEEGYKIDSIQSLLQCPGVLVCAGREPSHPLIIEKFEKTSSYKLPKLCGKSRATENTDGNERLTAKRSTILPNIEDHNRVTKQSVSSDKSVPDGRDSPDIVNSCLSSGESMREDDIEKLVRVNKDGSLSMEMKVRFRLPNDETLHWSTKVKKTVGQTYDHFKGHNNPNLAQVSDVNCSESQIRSADEACFTQQHQEHKEKPHCPYCCCHCQGYKTWKNVSETHDGSWCNHSSSSSTSSHTVVSRKTVIERQTMSRSSEELADRVVETGIMESIEAAEMVEFCTIERETCSPKCNAKPSTLKNGDSTGLHNCPKNLDLKTAQESDQKEEQAGSATCASQTFKGDDEIDDGDDGSFYPFSNPDRQEITGSEALDTALLIPHQPQVSKNKTSKTSEQNIKLKTSKESYICHCGEPEGVQIELKENTETKAGGEGQMQRHKSSAMSGKSDASCCSNKSEEIQKVDRSSLSMKSCKSSESEKAPHVQYKSEEEEVDSEVRTQSSLSAFSSVSAELKTIAQEASEEEDIQFTTEETENSESYVKSVISEKSTGSRKSKTTGEKTVKNLSDNQAEGGIRPSLMSATSGRSSVSPTSRTPVRTTSALSAKSNISTKSRESKTPEVYVVKKSDITENDNTEGDSELRPQSKLSVKSEKSVRSNISAKSRKSKTMEVTDDERSSVVSQKSFGSKSVTHTEQNDCKDDGATVARGGSAMSVKSGMSQTSAVSLKSETSQVSKTHSGNLCDERNDLHATPGRSSCMSDKSMKSNISERSSNLKGCDKLNKDNVGNEVERGPSATSVKSANSNVTSESTFSMASAKSKKSEPSDCFADQNSRDYTEQRERAPSNMSAASGKTSKSHASAACMKEDASDVCCNPSEGMLTEEAIEERSLSSKSQNERSASALSAVSNQSKNSTKSTRSNTSNIDASIRPVEDTNEEAIQERVPSVLSVKSVKSTTSTKSTKSKGSIHTPREKNSAMSGKNEEELLQERSATRGSPVSERSVKSAERSHSVLSAISKVSDIESVTSVEISDKTDYEDETEQRAQSVESTNTVQSITSAKSTKSTEHDGLYENIANCGEILERAASNMSARSEKSTNTNISTVSKRSKVSAGCLEVVYPEEGVYEGESGSRSVSSQSVESTVSAKSNHSMHSDNVEMEDGSMSNERKRHEHVDERPPSRMSAKSVQSCVSEISIKSAERTPSSFSVKSVKSHTTGIGSRRFEDESNVTEKTQTRAQSVLSTETGRSESSAKSNKSKGLDSPADENLIDDEKHVERSPSNLSVKSEKSTKSNTSTGSKQLKVSRICLEKRDAETPSEDQPSSPHSVRSYVSVKSNKSKGCIESPVARSSDNDNSDYENDKETNIERPRSSESTSSVQSSVSKTSIDSDVTIASNLSEKSHASVISDLTNISELSSGRPVLLDEVDCEEEEKTPSVISVKSLNSSISDRPAKSERMDREKHEERSSSNLSLKSGTSAKSNVSKRSEVYEVQLENNADYYDGRIVEGESEESTISVVSAQSVKSQCERIDNENSKRPPSSTSAKSVITNISEKSANSADRPQSASSARSVKSVQSNISDSKSGKTVEICDTGTESQERANSALSSKTEKSTSSTKYSKVKEHQSPTDEHDGEHGDRNPSSMSTRSVTLPKSNFSDISQESKASAVTYDPTSRSDNKDGSQEEDSEIRSMSSMSIHSVKSDISARSGMLKCSTDIPFQEIRTRSDSPASVISIKSNSSGVFSDINPTGEITDEKPSQDRSESVISAKSTFSKNSNKSNFSGAPTEGHVCDLDQLERPPSNVSIKSATSAMSHVSVTSTKSKAFNTPSEHDQEKTASDIEEEGNLSTSKSNVSGCSKKSRCSDVAAAQSEETPNGDYSKETMHDRAESRTSVQTGCSHVSERITEDEDEQEKRKERASGTLSAELTKSLSTESVMSVKSSESKVDAVLLEDYVTDSNSNVERAASTLSDRSAKSKASAQSKVSKEGKSKEENVERVPSCMSTNSVGESISLVSDGTLNKENTYKRSSSNTSINLEMSSRVTTQCEGTSLDNISNEEKAQRPPSNLSAKSAKSSTSKKSCKLHISDKPGEETNVENMNRTLNNPSVKSKISRDSDGDSNNPQTLNLSPENVTDFDENVEDTDIKALSPVSLKSVKTKASSVSTKSKASHSQIAKEKEQSQRTNSVLSMKSDTSSRTIQSNRSRITPRTGIGKNEDINDSMSDLYPNTLIDSDIPKEESNAYKDGLEKSEGTLISVSTKSLKSKSSGVSDEESSTYVEDRAISPVSAKSDLSEVLSGSEVPSVKIEESEGRCPTATSSKSKASGRSKKSRTSNIQGAKSARKSQSSLSVQSHLSVKAKKNNVTDVSIASVVSKKSREGGTPSDVQEGPTNKKINKTKKSRNEGKEESDICLNKHPVICSRDSGESDLSQTLSCSDKEICETSSPGESKSHVSNRVVHGPLETADTVSDKSDKGSKHKKKKMDEGNFELVPSTLPNTSPTEVVNEWLKTLPTVKDIYEMEELIENDNGVKHDTAAEDAIGTEDAEEKSEAENSNGVNGMDNVQNNNCQTSTEVPNEDNACTQREDGSKMFNSSIQVMKVLLNPKLDRCNSLPEISPVYGRKLSTSAQGLLDCLVKLQLIDHDPVKADEKNERYHELMSILQSLWLSDPSKEEHVQNTNYPHSVEEEYNHTSSSGVDVNSGSTGSGKSSDGVKSSTNVNVDGSHPPNSLMMIEKESNETDAQWKPEIEVKQEEHDSATDETIRSNDSPREPPETPSSSNKSSGESSGNDEKLSKKPSQDPDPVWVLTLLNKIEKQFMTHYISAMKELKVRWSLGDTNQLDMIIDELQTEVHKKIQISIDREVKKIQGRGGLPRPPNEPKTRTSTNQTEERRRGLNMKLQQSMDSLAEKSDSTTGTSYSDQRGEHIDEHCPCETCVEKKYNSLPPLSLEVRRTAPVVMDYDLKRILMMKTAIDHTVPWGNENDTTTAETLVEQVIDGAIKEVQSDKVQKNRDEAFEFTEDEKEEDNACQDDQAAMEETVKVFGIVNNEISKASAERPGSGSGTTYTVGEQISEVETASEEGTDDAVTPGGETGSNVSIKVVKKDTKSEDDEETTETMSPSHKYITAATMEFPNHADDVHDDTVAFANTEVQCKDVSEQEEKDVFVEESSLTKEETGHEEAKKDWLKLKRKLLPSVRIILQGKNSKQSVTNAENNGMVTVNDIVKDQTEKEESEDKIVEAQESKVSCEDESSEEAECTENEGKEPAVEVCEAQTTKVKSSEEDDEKAEMDEDSFSDMRSNATLSEDEKQAVETSSIATSEHRSETDMTIEKTPAEILTSQKSDTEEVRENTGTTSEQDSVEESGSTSDEDENEATISELSIIEEEGASDDELSVTSEAELKKMEITAVRYEEAKKSSESESEVYTSEQEDVAEESIVNEENEKNSVNSNDSPDENEVAIAESSGEPDEVATTEDELDVKKQTAVTGECETEMAASSDQESVHEKAKEAKQINPQEDMDDAEVIKGSSATSEDEHESETATSEHKSEKDGTEEDGTITDEEKIPDITSDDNEDENRDLSTEDESSEEHNKSSTTGDEISTDKEIDLTQNRESKHEIARDKNVADGMGNKECEEAGTVDDETDGTASESDSAEDTNSNTHDDETAEEDDATNSDLSTECAINDTKVQQAGVEATATNVYEFEGVEEEDALDCEDQTGKVKNRYDLGCTSEAEGDDMEDEIDTDTTENKSGKDALKEATSRDGSDSDDGTNEEKEDQLKKEQSIETTDAEDLDTAKSSDSADDIDALTNDETSVAETEQEINKAHNVSTEKEPVQTTGGEESDASAEGAPGSTIERSSIAVSENSCEEEGNSSVTGEEKSANNLTVKDEESGDEDSEAKSENNITDATSQDYTDENESLSQTHKDYKMKHADLSETKTIGREITKSDRSEDACEEEGIDVKSGHEESENEAEDGSGEEKEPQSTENQDAAVAALNDSVKDSEKDEEDTDTANEGWSRSLGDSADGEDEAEEDSEPEEDTDDRQKPFVPDKRRSSDATKRDEKKTLSIPLEPLMKERAESEDGVYADVEDSETEIHSQENVTSLEVMSLKR